MSPATKHLVVVPRASVEAVVDYFGTALSDNERPRGVPDLSDLKAALLPATLVDEGAQCLLERSENAVMIRKAREHLGFKRRTMAHLLGYRGDHAEKRMQELEQGRRVIPASTMILMAAYVGGYRPQNWPEEDLR